MEEGWKKKRDEGKEEREREEERKRREKSRGFFRLGAFGRDFSLGQSSASPTPQDKAKKLFHRCCFDPGLSRVLSSL